MPSWYCLTISYISAIHMLLSLYEIRSYDSKECKKQGSIRTTAAWQIHISKGNLTVHWLALQYSRPQVSHLFIILHNPFHRIPVLHALFGGQHMEDLMSEGESCPMGLGRTLLYSTVGPEDLCPGQRGVLLLEAVGNSLLNTIQYNTIQSFRLHFYPKGLTQSAFSWQHTLKRVQLYNI